MSRALRFLSVVLLMVGRLPAAPPAETRERDLLSPVFEVDKRYKSMLGPQATARGTIFAPRQDNLIWLTGFESTVEDEAGTQLSQEFMCHTNLRYGERTVHLQRTVHPNLRLFTISQGQYGVRFPEGFGIPVMSSTSFAVDNQVLNMNVDPGDGPLRLRFRNRVIFVRDADLESEMTPLYQVEAGVLASLEGDEAYVDTLSPDETQHGASCAPGAPAGDDRSLFSDHADQQFTFHWVLDPGEEVRRTIITSMLDLQYDTTVHFIAVHMHPYARSLALRDLTAAETLFVSQVKNFENRPGIADVEFFSSREGLPVYRDHEYELVSTYDNTTGEPQDAMAMMYLYLRDKRFVRPGAE